MAKKRKDSKGRVLKEGESERVTGNYQYRWRDKTGNRRTIYGKDLNELREKKVAVLKDEIDGIRVTSQRVTVNDMYNIWVKIKKGIKKNTFQNYKYMYGKFVEKKLGKYKLVDLKRSDVRRFYNDLVDNKGVGISTLDTIHTVIFQVLELAVEEDRIRNNPSSNALRELKKTHNIEEEKRKALTAQEHEIFINYLNRSEIAKRWKPIFTVMINTGLRVGEVTGLTWDDIDFENNTISVNRTLVYYKHEGGKTQFSINTPKTKSGYRKVPMMNVVRDAFLEEKELQEILDIPQGIIVDGYTGFVFLNRFGGVQNQSMLNKSLRRIVSFCNEELLSKAKEDEEVVLVPRMSCHILRHTFATRQVEAGINLKVIQETLGHADIATTMNIYADATEELKSNEFDKLQEYLKEQNINGLPVFNQLD